MQSDELVDFLFIWDLSPFNYRRFIALRPGFRVEASIISVCTSICRKNINLRLFMYYVVSRLHRLTSSNHMNLFVFRS
jgi:hypothetical protein